MHTRTEKPSSFTDLLPDSSHAHSALFKPYRPKTPPFPPSIIDFPADYRQPMRNLALKIEKEESSVRPYREEVGEKKKKGGGRVRIEPENRSKPLPVTPAV